MLPFAKLIKIIRGHIIFGRIVIPVSYTHLPNILKGGKATLRLYDADYSFEAPYKEQELSTLTDGDLRENACEDVEHVSTHKDDVWAIFTAPDEKGWNLSKVVVTIPYDNMGTDDNGDDSQTNKEIKIAMGLSLIHIFHGSTLHAYIWLLCKFRILK